MTVWDNFCPSESEICVPVRIPKSAPAITLFEGDEIVTAHDLILPSAGIKARVDMEDINEELIRYLALHPEKMQDIHPRKFEELVAQLFKSKGYDVILTPKTKDGGLDIRAYQKSDTGTLLGLVECKRCVETKKLSVDIVRGLYGVVESEKASFGQHQHSLAGRKLFKGRIDIGCSWPIIL